MKGCPQRGKNPVRGKRRGKTLKMDSKKALYPLRYKAFSLEQAPTFDTLIFEEIRKYARDFFKGTIVGRTVFHKELPFAVFCSMDFDVCP